MLHIPVIDNFSNNYGYIREYLNLTKAGLHSVIGGFKSVRFGLDTMYDKKQQIRKFKDEVMNPCQSKLYIDSGGYSFIKGDIKTSQISKMIDCYHSYLETEKDCYDYIFSLDLPLNLKEPEFNTKDNVYKYNRLSLDNSVEILRKYPMIQDKFYLVWHFKMKGQYEIWDKLYTELNLKEVIRHRAIGGMVGLHQLAKIKFSPFIALSFRCFKDYLDAQRFDHDFRLHMLGIYTQPDCLSMHILEKLFQRYLDGSGIGRKAVITHDSINTSLSAHKSGGKKKVFCFDNDKLTEFADISAVPDEIFRQIYMVEEHFTEAMKNREFFKMGKTLTGTSSFTPLYLFSYLEFDKFIDYTIQTHGLIDILIQSAGYIKFARRLKEKVDDLKKWNPNVFTKNFINVMIENMETIFKFHQWYYVQKGDNQSLDRLIHAFTDMIGFGEIL